jgi:alpha-L-fucosidase
MVDASPDPASAMFRPDYPMRFSRIIPLLLGLVLAAGAAEPVLRSLDEADPARDARVAWHEAARFGCFVHWGVYSALGNEWQGRPGGTYGEHLMRVMKIPRAIYLEQVAKSFNPEQFDADAWVKLMREAGMRYLIITAKHHDGFALYPSQIGDFTLAVTPFRRDPMAELSAACKKHGLKFGFYYSHAFDWEHPDAPGNDWDYNNPGGDKNRDDPNWWQGRRPDFLPQARHYVDEKSIPQIRELIAKYRPDIMWFDTPSKLPPEENRRILAAVSAAGPDVVVNGRLLGNHGDYKNTADRPAYCPDTPGHWEGIPTTNESYGYSKFDHTHKPVAHFIQLLAISVSKGGNMLMNIGPKGDGTIDAPDQAILHGIGAWMERNSGSIYGAGRTPLPVQNWGTSTRKGDKLYLHVFRWPADGKLLVTGLRSEPASARLLASNVPVGPLRRIGPLDLEFTVPAAAPDAADSVIELDFAAAPVANRARLLAAKGEPTVLHVFDGQLAGRGIRYGDAKRNNDVVNEWSDAGGTVSWPVRVTAPGQFKVTVNYSTAGKDNAGRYAVTVAGQQIEGQVTPTEKVSAFRDDVIGELALPAGEHTLTVRAIAIAGGNLMRLRQLELTPVR